MSATSMMPNVSSWSTSPVAVAGRTQLWTFTSDSALPEIGHPFMWVSGLFRERTFDAGNDLSWDEAVVCSSAANVGFRLNRTRDARRASNGERPRSGRQRNDRFEVTTRSHLTAYPTYPPHISWHGTEAKNGSQFGENRSYDPGRLRCLGHF